jgi:hypothetical protein
MSTRRPIGAVLAEQAHRSFVGRSGQLRLLEELVGPSGEARVVYLHGDAGIGKSALLAAFLERMQVAGAAVAMLDCRSIEPTEPGLVEALRVAAGAGGEVYSLYAIGGVAGEHWYDDEDIAVFRFSPEGKYLARFGGQGREPGQYGPPSAIATDPRGRVYVCESFDKLHVYEPDGRFVRTLKIPHAADALAFDAQGDLYIAGSHRVSKLILNK